MIYRKLVRSKEELVDRITIWKARKFEVTQFYENREHFPCMLCFYRFDTDDKTFIDYFLVYPEDIK